MPGMNGIEAARRIRELMQPDPAIIIMVTAFGRRKSNWQATAAGFEGIPHQPVNPSVLIDTILSAFSAAVAIPAVDSQPAVEASLLVNRRVLLVEDNEINQEVAVELLQRAGLIVDVAINGREACGPRDGGRLRGGA